MLGNAVSVIVRVLVLDFYQKYATLFITVGGIAMGFIRGQDHIMLGQLFVQSPILLTIPCCLWLLYGFLALQANRECLQRPENEFLFALRIVPRSKQFLVIVVSQLVQLLPTLVYAIFLLTIALQQGQVTSLILLALAIPTLTLLSTFLLYRSIMIMVEADQSRVVKWLNRKVTRPSSLFFVEWIFRQQYMAVVAVKTVSILLLFGILALYQTDSSDGRLLGMAISISAGIHLNYVYEAHRFHNFHFSFLRGLPLHVFKQQYQLLISFMLLVLPEIGMLVQCYTINISVLDILACTTLLFSNIILFDGWLYTKERNSNEQSRFIFFFAMTEVVLILFHVPVVALTIANGVIGTLIKTKYYYLFEYTAKK